MQWGTPSPESPLSQDLVATAAEYSDGYVTLPVDRPGLGIELDYDVVKAYRQ